MITWEETNIKWTSYWPAFDIIATTWFFHIIIAFRTLPPLLPFSQVNQHSICTKHFHFLKLCAIHTWMPSNIVLHAKHSLSKGTWELLNSLFPIINQQCWAIFIGTVEFFRAKKSRFTRGFSPPVKQIPWEDITAKIRLQKPLTILQDMKSGLRYHQASIRCTW